MLFWQRFKNHDWPVTLLLLLLNFVGLIVLFSTTRQNTLQLSSDFVQQSAFLVIGLVAYFALSAAKIEWLHEPKVQIGLFTITVLLLLLTLFLGNSSQSPSRWLYIGPVSFQPSEFAKLFVILSTASVFKTVREVRPQLPPDWRRKLAVPHLIDMLKQDPWPKLLLNTVGMLIVFGLVLIQPSLGNALLLIGLWLLMLASLIPNPIYLVAYALFTAAAFVAVHFHLDGLLLVFGLIWLIVLHVGLKLNNLITFVCILLGIMAAASSNFVWENVLTQYQQDRIEGFLSPDQDPLGAGWQVSQAKTAIASGQIFGRGFLMGSQVNLGLLPYAYTDFAYSAYTEQFGVAGATLLIFLYYLLIMRVLVIAANRQDSYEKLLCIGVAFMLTISIGVNLSMNLGLLPVTGVPLPFISYGGSSLLVNLLGLGLVQMINSDNQATKMSVTKLYAISN